MAKIKETSEESFEKDVLEESSSRPVLVDFWAPWCGPCLSLAPILEKIANDLDGKILLAKVNVDDNPMLAQKFNVRGIPSVKLFIDGKVVSDFVGSRPESAVLDWLKPQLD